MPKLSVMPIQTIPLQTRSAELVPSTWDEAQRTIDVAWTQGAQGRRYAWDVGYYDEELQVSAEAINLERFEAGTAPVLNTHGAYDLSSVLGVVLPGSTRISGGEAVSTIKLTAREDMAGIVQDILAGVIRGISVGYRVHRYEVTQPKDRQDGGQYPLYRAVSWTPMELSFVPIPFDSGASTRSAEGDRGYPCEVVGLASSTRVGELPPTVQEASMPNPTQGGATPETRGTDATPATPVAALASVDAEAIRRAADAAAVQRSTEIIQLCTRAGVPEQAADLIAGGQTLDQVRAHILELRFAADQAAGGRVNVVTVRDEGETRLRSVETALLARVAPGVTLDDGARQFRGMSLIEIGRQLLEVRGVKTGGMGRMQIAEAMLTQRSGAFMGSSDFTFVMSNLVNKRLRTAYEQNPGSYRVWARRAPDAPDFKTINVTQMSSAPELLQTNEHGEFKYGSMSDGGVTYSVGTYGRVVPFSRQAIVNDDLRALDRLVAAFGQSAARLENRLAYAQLTGNPVMGDGKALFDVAHANSAATTPISVAGLATGRTAMRQQKGLQGEVLNITPAYLIVPSVMEQEAYQYTSTQFVPAKSADVNEFRAGGRTALEPVVEPILDAVSVNQWYLVADGNACDTVEYCYLDGADGVVLETNQTVDVDGVNFRPRLDFVARAVEWRGIWRGSKT